jgi:hypothetical protein
MHYLCHTTDYDTCTIYGSTTSKGYTNTFYHSHYCINTHRDATAAVIQTSTAATGNTTAATTHLFHANSAIPSATTTTTATPSLPSTTKR